MVKLEGDNVVFSWPDDHGEASLKVSCCRALRESEGDRGTTRLGDFHLTEVARYAEKARFAEDHERSAFFPMYQSEALSFLLRAPGRPVALRIQVGDLNGFSGKPWSEGWSPDPQDYAVVSGSIFIDRFRFGRNRIAQFVAPPLSTQASPATPLRIVVAPIHERAYKALPAARVLDESSPKLEINVWNPRPPDFRADPYGIAAWDISRSEHHTLYALNSEVYLAVTGARPFTRPRTRGDYDRAGLTWREEYGADRQVLV